jgi:hypothetical protein
LPAAASYNHNQRTLRKILCRRYRSTLIHSRRKTTHQKPKTTKNKPPPPPICFDPSLPPSKLKKNPKTKPPPPLIDMSQTYP